MADDLMFFGSLVKTEDVERLKSVIPDHLTCDSESIDIDTAGVFIGCVNTAWHDDKHLGIAGSILLLVDGYGVVVETRADKFTMNPGDAVVLNVNVEHRGTCPQGGYAVFLAIDLLGVNMVRSLSRRSHVRERMRVAIKSELEACRVA